MRMLTLLIGLVCFTFSLSADPGDQATELWDQLLRSHVDAQGNVDYYAFKSDPKFDECLAAFQDQHPDASWKKSEKMSFWINVYNAFTVKLIVNNYPLKSITDLDNPWDQSFIILKGKQYSLNQIEHDILRPQFKDPRVHFAVNCASYSCPKLDNNAFRPETLDASLTKLAKEFLNDSKRNKLTSSPQEVSQIFDWFKEDFDAAGGVISFINSYAEVNIPAGTTLKYMEYKWQLNGK
ncbi:MAG: hypothetical protein ACI80P_000910 [Flavobacteriales bacterium]|jgi:hypothetical protein